MKCLRKFGGKPYTYVGTYWDREVVRLCLRTGRDAGYLMRQTKVTEGPPPPHGQGRLRCLRPEDPAGDRSTSDPRGGLGLSLAEGGV